MRAIERKSREKGVKEKKRLHLRRERSRRKILVGGRGGEMPGLSEKELLSSRGKLEKGRSRRGDGAEKRRSEMMFGEKREEAENLRVVWLVLQEEEITGGKEERLCSQGGRNAALERKSQA